MSWWPAGRRPPGETIEAPLGVHQDIAGTPTVMMKLGSGQHLSLDMTELTEMCQHHDERLSCSVTPAPVREQLERERQAALRAALMLHNRYPHLAIPLAILRPQLPEDPHPGDRQRLEAQIVYERLLQKFARHPSP